VFLQKPEFLFPKKCTATTEILIANQTTSHKHFTIAVVTDRLS
jgi:hypothetical protein